MKLITSLAIVLFALAACQSADDSHRSATSPSQSLLTPAMIAQLDKGKSTRDEVIKLFGAPNIITQNSNGREVWHYSRMSYERRSRSDSVGTGLVPSILVSSKQSKAFASGSSRSVDLAITFNSVGRVESYKSVSSQF